MLESTLGTVPSYLTYQMVGPRGIWTTVGVGWRSYSAACKLGLWRVTYFLHTLFRHPVQEESKLRLVVNRFMITRNQKSKDSAYFPFEHCTSTSNRLGWLLRGLQIPSSP